MWRNINTYWPDMWAAGGYLQRLASADQYINSGTSVILSSLQ